VRVLLTGLDDEVALEEFRADDRLAGLGLVDAAQLDVADGLALALQRGGGAGRSLQHRDTRRDTSDADELAERLLHGDAVGVGTCDEDVGGTQRTGEAGVEGNGPRADEDVGAGGAAEFQGLREVWVGRADVLKK